MSAETLQESSYSCLSCPLLGLTDSGQLPARAIAWAGTGTVTAELFYHLVFVLKGQFECIQIVCKKLKIFCKHGQMDI